MKSDSEILKAYNIGAWEADLSGKYISLDSIIASRLNLASTKATLGCLINCIATEDKCLIGNILNRKSEIYSGKELHLNIHLNDRVYNTHVIIQSVSGDLLSGYVRIEEKPKLANHHIYNNLYGDLPIGLLLYDAMGNVVKMSNTAMKLLNLNSDILPTIPNLFEDSNFSSSFRQTLKQGKETLSEIMSKYIMGSSCMTKDKLCHIIYKGATIKDNKGQVIGYVVVMSDETSHIETSIRIKDFDNFFDIVTGFARFGYFKWDLATNIGFASKQWYNNMGVEDGLDIRQAVANNNLIHPDDVFEINQLLDKMAIGEIQSLQKEIRVADKPSGQYRWIYYSLVTTNYDPAQNSVEITGVNIDINKFKTVEMRLDELSKQNNIVSSNLSTALIYIDRNYIVKWGTNALNPMLNTHKYIHGDLCYKTAYDRNSPCEGCPLTKMLSTGKPATKEIDSQGYTVEITANPAYDNRGMLSGGIMRLEDITHRKFNERKITELNHLMEAILNNTPVCLFVKDPNYEFKYLYWNKAMADYTKVPTASAVGKTDYEVFPVRSDAEHFREDDLKLLNDRKTITFEEEFIDACGNSQYVSTIKTLIPTENGLPWILGMSWDITKMKQDQNQLIKEKEAAQESDKFKSLFVANMSHEIRTPLNAIVGFSELLTDKGLDDADRREYITIIQKNNQLLLQLISDILDLSRIEARMLEFHYDQVNINDLCTRIATAYNKNQETKVPIIFDGKSVPAYFVYSDENRIQQIITNFVNNATKFTSKGHIKIGIEQLAADNCIKIYVEDTGMGIRQDKVDTVFDRFVKLNSCIQGTGLGLAICKNLVEQLGGQIGVESEFGKGSCFWFTLPTK